MPRLLSDSLSDSDDEDCSASNMDVDSKQDHLYAASMESKEGKLDVSTQQPWRLSWWVGKQCDALETGAQAHWCPAEVFQINKSERKVLIWFTDWSHKWDEWLPFDSTRLAPAGSFVYSGEDSHGKRRFLVGQRVEVFDEHPSQQKFAEATIVAIKSNVRVKVHFKGYVAKWDEWLPYYSKRVRRFCYEKHIARQSSQSVPQIEFTHSAVLKSQDSFVNTFRNAKRVIASKDPRYARYRNAIENFGFRIQPVEGDGNCLFRSVAHQIYGNDEKVSNTGVASHIMVRRCAMDYMESQRLHFEPFVSALRMFDGMSRVKVNHGENNNSALTERSIGENCPPNNTTAIRNPCDDVISEGKYNTESNEHLGIRFENYLTEMRKDAVWGGDPEITAMCELYDRPAEIYCYCPIHGARILRSFHESRRGHRTPIRLSFYGGGHYDSIIGPGTVDAFLSSVPGVSEERRINLSLTMANTITINEANGVVEDEMSRALRESRELYNSGSQDIETSLWLLLQDKGNEDAPGLAHALITSNEEAAAVDNDLLQKAVQMSVVEAGADSSISTEQQILEHAMLESTRLHREAQNDVLQQALKASKSSSETNDAQTSIEERNRLLKMHQDNEEKQVRDAIAASMESVGVDETSVATLMATGFTRDLCLQALSRSGGNIDIAMNILLANSQYT